MRDDITLYLPRECGEGDNRSAKIYYKGIKDFKKNTDGTVTFKTQKHGTVTTPLFWKLNAGLPDDAPEGGVAPRARANRDHGGGY